MTRSKIVISLARFIWLAIRRRLSQGAAGVLLGLVGLASAAAGVCGLALWIFPSAPPWAIVATIAGSLTAAIGIGAVPLLGLLREGWSGTVQRGIAAKKPKVLREE